MGFIKNEKYQFMPDNISSKKSSTVLEAIVLALMIHAVVLIVLFFADEGMFTFSKKKTASKDVKVEFIELTEELLALAAPEESAISELLDKYKNVTAKEGTVTSDKAKSYRFDKNQTDKEVLKEILAFEQNEFDKLKKEDNSLESSDPTDDSSEDSKSADNSKNSSSPNSNTSYSKATAKFDFSRDPEYRKTPTYTCRLFGQIVVEIEVDRNGGVISAKGISGDLDQDCLLSQSEEYAKKWKFKSASRASKSEKGTITFTFLPQKK